jgi:sulfonate transport system substrate-binding protein
MTTPRILLPLSIAALLLVLAAVGPAPARAADVPKVIRIGYPGVGTGNRPAVGGSSPSTLHLQGLLEDELKKDGIAVQWFHFRQAGPAINEAFANGLLDFAYEGDLAMIIGRAGGLKTRLLAGGGQGSPVAVAVPSDSPVKSVADLKGKRVVIAKGTAIQLAAARVLARFGLSEKDLRVINIVGPGSTDVLATKDADAVFGLGSGFYPLRDRGIARIVYESADPDVTIVAGFLGHEDFIQKYPAITQRVVTALVRASQYSSIEANRNALFKLWSQDGTGFGYYKETYTDRKTGQPIPLALRTTPLADDYWVGKVRAGIDDSLKFRLIRRDVDVRAWLDTRFLDQALKDLALEAFWVRYAADGKPVS